jgi:hypothetical protein
MYIKIEGCRLNWIRSHQPKIRADLYKGIVDSITAEEICASTFGTRSHSRKTLTSGAPVCATRGAGPYATGITPLVISYLCRTGLVRHWYIHIPVSHVRHW